MERREIKKALAKAMPKSRKIMKEPMAEPIARAPFEGPRCNQKSIIEFKRSIPGAFIVDLKAHDGRMVSENLKVPFGKETRVFDEVEKKEIVLWTDYQVVPSLRWLRKRISKIEYPTYKLETAKDVDGVVDLLRNGKVEDQIEAYNTLQYALKKGVDMRRHSMPIAEALYDKEDIVRISAASLLHGMAFRDVDISGAEELLIKALEDDNKLVQYYSALALGRMYWNNGNWTGLQELMPLMSKQDRKIIMGSIEEMPSQLPNDPYRA